MEIHFIDVGCGNMTLLLFPDGTAWLYDCHVTTENESSVLTYLRHVLGREGRTIGAFICSHRDADHMRGIKAIHRHFPFAGIWDNGIAGTTIDSPEYREYIDLRRQINSGEITAGYVVKCAGAKIAWINSRDSILTDVNDQSIAAMIDFNGSSAVLAGDTSYRPWRDRIVPSYGASLKANILLGSHHGSLTFFHEPGDSHSYYTEHIASIRPEMTIISVGKNVHGLPDRKALELYENHSSGSNTGEKIWMTDTHGHMKLILLGAGQWSLSRN